jgi:hypothetical protein
VTCRCSCCPPCLNSTADDPALCALPRCPWPRARGRRARYVTWADHAAVADHNQWCCSFGSKAGPLLFLGFSITELPYSINSTKFQEFRTSFPKFVENKIKFIKIQSKFLWDPLERFYEINLTTSSFAQLCII